MTLVKKLILWFAAGIAVLLVLIGATVSVLLDKNTESTVIRNMTELMTYSAAAVKQTLSAGNIPANSAGFEKISEKTAVELNRMLGCGVACYDNSGALLCSTYETEDFSESELKDLSYALNGQNAYTLVQDDGAMTAYFSVPVQSEGKSIGILRLQVDYTELYSSNTYTITLMMWGAAAVLCVTAAMLALALLRVIKPIKKLSEEIKRTTQRPERAETLPVKSRDEIGRLTEQYNRMALTIRSQLKTIRTEKDRLSRTLEYKKAFYDNLTHELKTPLTIILGYAEMMEQTDFEDAVFVRKGTDEIISESRRLADMVAALLENSRADTESFKPEEVDALELISQVTSAMDIKARRYGSGIETMLCEAKLFGDAEHLRQLFVNLTDNAIKYGRPGHPVKVDMKVKEDILEVSVINLAEKGRTLGDAEKVFLPFYRSRDSKKKREDGSVGLGLSICKNIAEEHAGSITAEEKNGIVRFTVLLPLYGGPEVV